MFSHPIDIAIVKYKNHPSIIMLAKMFPLNHNLDLGMSEKTIRSKRFRI